MGGVAMIFGSCEAMILCAEGVGQKLKWNEFVAVTSEWCLAPGVACKMHEGGARDG